MNARYCYHYVGVHRKKTENYTKILMAVIFGDQFMDFF